MDEYWILLVDPSENVLNVYRAILEEKYLIESASNLEEAYDLLKMRRYSVMLTEYFPEDQATDRMLEQVKKLSPETYFIVVTDSLMMDDTTYQRLFENGLDDIILKPCPPQRILTHIRKGLRLREVILRKEEMEAQSLVDPVIPRITGLMERFVSNPVFFKKCLRQELGRAKRHHHSLSLLLIPIPCREKTGECFESLYKELANILSQHVREEDIVGSEDRHFGILLPDTDEAGSHTLMDRLLGLIQSHPPFKSDELLKAVAEPLLFQSFTYPEKFSIPESLMQ